jgi:hypothetical protein
MKIKLIYTLLFAFLIVNTGCEEEDPLSYEVIGMSTDTITNFSASKTAPAPGEDVTLTAYYVNIAEDPASELKIFATVGSGERTEVFSSNESSAATDAEITRTFTWTAPTVAATTPVVLDFALYTQKDFPKITRSTVSITP